MLVLVYLFLLIVSIRNHIYICYFHLVIWSLNNKDPNDFKYSVWHYYNFPLIYNRCRQIFESNSSKDLNPRRTIDLPIPTSALPRLHGDHCIPLSTRKKNYLQLAYLIPASKRKLFVLMILPSLGCTVIHSRWCRHQVPLMKAQPRTTM